MTGFVPPPLVWETLGEARAAADAHPDGAIDLTIGTPVDDPPAFVHRVMAHATTVRGYPPSIGTEAFRSAASRWLGRRFDVDVAPSAVGAAIGTKELVAGLPHWLRLRGDHEGRDTVLHPAVAYPTYAMGARLAGCRSVAVPPRPDGSLDLSAIDPGDADRALCIWSNSPSNPTGALDDLAAVAGWGRERGIPVLSDECYAELTWDGPPRSILQHGSEGVLAVHSLSKRSNLAGLRVGFYAGDPDLVTYLGQLRKHAGFMVPGPAQEVAAAALDDDEHAARQARTYLCRIERVLPALAAAGLATPRPGGAFYLWVADPEGDGRRLARLLAERAGLLVTPGEAYGPLGLGHVRLALVVPDDTVDAVCERLRAARIGPPAPDPTDP